MSPQRITYTRKNVLSKKQLSQVPQLAQQLGTGPNAGWCFGLPGQPNTIYPSGQAPDNLGTKQWGNEPHQAI